MFYVAPPEGKVRRLGSVNEWTGSEDGRGAVWMTAISNGGVAVIAQMRGDPAHNAFAWDPKRGLRPLLVGPQPFADRQPVSLREAKLPFPYWPAAMNDGKWIFCWTTKERKPPAIPRGVMVMDLSK